MCVFREGAGRDQLTQKFIKAGTPSAARGATHVRLQERRQQEQGRPVRWEACTRGAAGSTRTRKSLMQSTRASNRPSGALRWRVVKSPRPLCSSPHDPTRHTSSTRNQSSTAGASTARGPPAALPHCTRHPQPSHGAAAMLPSVPTLPLPTPHDALARAPTARPLSTPQPRAQPHFRARRRAHTRQRDTARVPRHAGGAQGVCRSATRVGAHAQAHWRRRRSWKRRSRL